MDKALFFSSAKYFTESEVLEEVGVRGRRVMELASLGAPISPGCIVSRDGLSALSLENDESAAFLWPLVEEMGGIVAKKLGDSQAPMLIKVVESPMLNLVTTFSTIHNLGLTDDSVAGFGTYVGEDFAYHEYKYLLANFAFLEGQWAFEGSGRNVTASKTAELKAYHGALRGAKGKEGVLKVIEQYRNLLDERLYTDARFQLLWVIDRYKELFAANPTRSDSCLLVQNMVFGNYGEESYFGSFHTHDPFTGEDAISGEYFSNSFDDTKSEGRPISELPKETHGRLQTIANELENRFREIRRVRFTVESGHLWVIDQQQAVEVSAQAEVRTLLDLLGRKAVDDAYVISHVLPSRLSELLHSQLDPKSVAKLPKADGGIAGAVGAAMGRVFFSTDALLKAHRSAQQAGEDTNFILAMNSTFAEDVKAIEVARGVITAEGGYASHAPVVARSLGKVAMVNEDFRFQPKALKIGRRTVKEGDYLTIHVSYAAAPVVYFGKGAMAQPSPEESGLLDLLEVLQRNIGDFDVRANADQPRDAELAKRFKAYGVGLCRTEHMFFDESRIDSFREMIFADDAEERKQVLSQLKKMQADDFYGLFKAMDGMPVTIRLLDAPLHEFLPHNKTTWDGFLKHMKKKDPSVTLAALKARADLLEEFNPMLGHRGVRLAITYPEVYATQVEAILEAAAKLKKEGGDPRPEIMVPIVMSPAEIKAIRYGKRIEGKSITGIEEVAQEVIEKTGPMSYKVGTMIELPAAALQADKIARYAEFFSFGTNDLTQTTNGISRDDFNTFFSDYNEFDLLGDNPFQVLAEPIREMIEIAVRRGRLTRPGMKMGLCGEQGAEPANIPFLRSVGLDYVSVSPYGIPIAKLAIAQMNVKEQSGTSAD